MTITNHIRRIEEMSADIIRYVDSRQYASAHCALDEIAKRTRLARRHIEHLQHVTSPYSVVPGEQFLITTTTPNSDKKENTHEQI